MFRLLRVIPGISPSRMVCWPRITHSRIYYIKKAIRLFQIYYPSNRIEGEMDRIKIWPNGIVFEFGMLHSWHMFTFANLRRIINYSIEKSENGGYPLLSWPVWRHMAVNKLKVPEGLAWSYFEVFDAIQESALNERIAKATKRSELSLQEYQSQRYVSTLKFVLFLFTQTISSNRLRNSSFSERFPDQKQPGSARQGSWTLEIFNLN